MWILALKRLIFAVLLAFFSHAFASDVCDYKQKLGLFSDISITLFAPNYFYHTNKLNRAPSAESLTKFRIFNIEKSRELLLNLNEICSKKCLLETQIKEF